MQDLQIECEKCGTTLTIVREWPDGWKYRATVEPCPECIEAAQQKRAADGAKPPLKICSACKRTVRVKVDGTMIQHHDKWQGGKPCRGSGQPFVFVKSPPR